MDHRELEAKVRDNVNAWNRHDAAACVAMLAPDCVLSDNGRPVPGRTAIQARMQEYFNAFPQLKLELLSLYVAGDNVLTEWQAAGTRAGPLTGIPMSRTSNETTGTCVEEFAQDGLVHRSTMYWDTARLLRDFGVPVQRATA